MSSITITLPGGGTETIQLPPNVPNIPSDLVAEIQKDIDKAEPKLAKELEAGLRSGKFHSFNQDVQKLVGKILKDAEKYPYVCFCAGTMIRTAHGDVPVEMLAIGDLIVTKSGIERPVVWLGQRTLYRETMVAADMPVRVRAGAFGLGLPSADLLLSPGHSVCVDMLGEVLVPVMHLINGATIAQENVPEVTYWHVELDAHDVVISNGLPSESYIECGNRGFFVGDSDRPERNAGLKDFCRPVLNDPVLFTALRSRIRSRALDMGWRIEHAQPMLGLEIEGSLVAPILSERDDVVVATWMVPAVANRLVLQASTFRPYYSSDSADLRDLGLRIRRVTIGGRTVALQAIGDDGFQRVESMEDETWRWTTGRASFAPTLLDDYSNREGEVVEMAIHFSNRTNAHWAEPVPRQVQPQLRLVAA